MPDWVEPLLQGVASGLSITRAAALAGTDRKQVYILNAQNEDFEKRLSRARELQQDALIEECHEIAEEATPEDWQVARLRIWERQWTAGKLRPRKYGEKVGVTGADGVTDPSFTVRLLTPLPEIQRDA